MLRHSVRTGWLIAITLWLVVGTAYAADPLPRATRPEEVGLSSERLERLTRHTEGTWALITFIISE